VQGRHCTTAKARASEGSGILPPFVEACNQHMHDLMVLPTLRSQSFIMLHL